MTCCSDVTLGAINSAPCHVNRLRLFGTSTAEKTAVVQYVNCTCRRNGSPDRSSPFAVQQFWYYHQYSCGASWSECAALEVNSTILISRSARGFQFNFPQFAASVEQSSRVSTSRLLNSQPFSISVTPPPPPPPPPLFPPLLSKKKQQTLTPQSLFFLHI